MKYFQRSTDIVAFAWNAAVVCPGCVREALTNELEASALVSGRTAYGLSALDLGELSELYARVILGQMGPLGDLDTADFPQPIFADQQADDSCDRCLIRIEDL